MTGCDSWFGLWSLLSEMLPWWSGEGDQGPALFRCRVDWSRACRSANAPEKRTSKEGSLGCFRIPGDGLECLHTQKKEWNPVGRTGKQKKQNEKRNVVGPVPRYSPESSSLSTGARERKRARERKQNCLRGEWRVLAHRLLDSGAAHGTGSGWDAIGEMHLNRGLFSPCIDASSR